MNRNSLLRSALVGCVTFVVSVALALSGSEADAGNGSSGEREDRSSEALVERGDYLANVVMSCDGCHTPKVRGQPDPSMKFAGWKCFVRGKLPDGTEPPVGTPASGADAGAGAFCGPGCEPDFTRYGCLNTSNLTNHETGLKHYTDDQVKEMIRHGKRPNGGAISPIMGYWAYSALTEYDLDAIVAYLRTLPGIDNPIPPLEWPWPVDEPARPLRDEKIWKPSPDAPNYESLMRGRYLATIACIECHSPYRPGLFAGQPFGDIPVDEDRLFSGLGFPWASELNKIPSPPFPRRIYSQNLTQDPTTGLAGWSPADIVRSVRDGVSKDGSRVCPPMPTGRIRGGAGHGRLAEQDLNDIANYIVALPGIVNQRPTDCQAPPHPMNIGLWLMQGLLALLFAFAGGMKATQPKEKLAKNTPYVEDYSQSTIRLIGVLEVLAALGLVLPMVTGILPVLTPLAAVGLVLTMVGAIFVHLRRKEYPNIAVNVLILVLAACVAYGRYVMEI